MGSRTAFGVLFGVLVLSVALMHTTEGSEVDFEEESLFIEKPAKGHSKKGAKHAPAKKSTKHAASKVKHDKGAKPAKDKYAAKLHSSMNKAASQDGSRLGKASRKEVWSQEGHTVHQERAGTYKNEPSPRNLASKTAAEVGKEAEHKVYAAARAKTAHEKGVKYTKRWKAHRKKLDKEAAESKARAERWAEEKRAARKERKQKKADAHYMKVVIAREHAKAAKKPVKHPERFHKKERFDSAAKKQLARATAKFRSKDAANDKPKKAKRAAKPKKQLPHGAHTAKKPKKPKKAKTKAKKAKTKAKKAKKKAKTKAKKAKKKAKKAKKKAKKAKKKAKKAETKAKKPKTIKLMGYEW